ncbi:MAG: hypothetical protein ACRDQ4_17885 [Pseudonocardiaceae bacterium]
MLTLAQRRRVATGWGRAAARLHAVRAAAFTEHAAGASWAEVVVARAEKLVAAHIGRRRTARPRDSRRK